jgi:hypothetical protein
MSVDKTFIFIVFVDMIWHNKSMKKNKKQTPFEMIKDRVETMNFSTTVNKSTKRLDFEKLKKLAEDVRKTFSDEDLKRFQPQC